MSVSGGTGVFDGLLFDHPFRVIIFFQFEQLWLRGCTQFSWQEGFQLPIKYGFNENRTLTLHNVDLFQPYCRHWCNSEAECVCTEVEQKNKDHGELF